MRYVTPKTLEEAEILTRLARTDLTPSERIDTVLSAVYSAKTDAFAGDVLIREFEEARYPEKHYLLNVFETFYAMRNTLYRVEDAEAVADAWAADAWAALSPENARETLSWREFVERRKAFMAERAHREANPDAYDDDDEDDDDRDEDEAPQAGPSR